MEDRYVAGEFLSEGVFDPVFLLIKDRTKLFYSEIDPPLLYDLESDPTRRGTLRRTAPVPICLPKCLARPRRCGTARR